MEIEQRYQQLDHREHIYKLPDTYIGSIENVTQELFAPSQEDDQGQQFKKRPLTFVPGFFKIFDEVLVNAIDHRQRDPSVRNIKISFDMGLSEICIQNDGNGIDIAVHSGTNKYVPEMLFSSLLTSTNYNENEKRTTGGKNGYGSKLTNIFSKYFIIETVDQERSLKYIQRFSENNQVIEPAKITKFSGKPYTKVTFLPDYEKFGLVEGITGDMFALLKKRVFDTTAVTPKDVSVWFNGDKLKIKSMEKYMELFIPGKSAFVESERWKIGLALSPDREFHQESFVNGIWTQKGGRHVDYIMQQVIERVRSVLSKNAKTKGKFFKPSQIKDNIWIFIDAVIENPSFSSQTKEELTTKVSQFGSTCTIEEKWIEKWMRTPNSEHDTFLDRMVETLLLESHKSLKKTDGSKKSVIRGIPKLEDAIHAGTRHSTQCTLILTEGDSAKASIISGLSVLGPGFRDIYGVFPLRGKFLNVRDISQDKVNNNEEVKNLKTILGLQHGKEYTAENLKELRYGSIAITTDADFDGSHIKGLVLNFLHFYWPSLLRIRGFIKSYITPIVKAFGTSSGSQNVQLFYTLKEYNQFRIAHEHERWNYKYYKGLGTSTGKEFKEYFSNIRSITRIYSWDEDSSLIMAFSKSAAHQRKEWLKVYDPENTVEYTENGEIFLSDFVHRELKHFSNYDNIRSIPNAIDGFKPSQRKVLFGMMKRKGGGEIKVAQLASFVSEQTNYHHGEVSLEQTIICLAQNFTGKNNVPLLQPKGQFGTIAMGGKDHAQSRYIFTELFDYTRVILNESDDPILDFQEDEGHAIEPSVYYPIIPLVLCNGCEGIGTGFSTFIPNFNPIEIIDALLERNKGHEQFKSDWIPWYKNFRGTIEPIPEEPQKFWVRGKYTLKEDEITTLNIEELPIGSWTQNYKEFLEQLLGRGVISSYVDKSTDERVHFIVQLNGKNDPNTIEQQFKLVTKLSLSNMYLYKENEIHKFDSVAEILEYFYQIRLGMYEKRKNLLLCLLKEHMEILNEKIKFISLVIEEPMLIFRQTKQVIQQQLISRNFIRIDSLLSMSMYSWTFEKISELQKELDKVQNDYYHLESKSPAQLWSKDLEILRKKIF